MDQRCYAGIMTREDRFRVSSYVDAQGLVEYGMIISFVALLAIGGLILLGPLMSDFFSSMTTSV